MRLGMIGLGRMGANMVRRLSRGGIEVVAYSHTASAVEALSRETGCLGAISLADLLSKRLVARTSDGERGQSTSPEPLETDTSARASVQRIVSLEEVPGLLNQGWSAVMPLDSTRFIVQAPANGHAT